jgi:hypothetical protein
MHGFSHGGVRLQAGAGFPNPVGGGGWVPGTSAPRFSQEWARLGLLVTWAEQEGSRGGHKLARVLAAGALVYAYALVYTSIYSLCKPVHVAVHGFQLEPVLVYVGSHERQRSRCWPRCARDMPAVNWRTTGKAWSSCDYRNISTVACTIIHKLD